MQTQSCMQLGKKGLTIGFLECLRNSFKTREIVRVSILKSAGHDKKSAEKIAREITNELGNRYTFKIVGFTIILKKWRKARSEKNI